MDRVTIEERGVPGITLMERAGFGGYQVARGLLGGTGRAVVVCGRGNNGGDGFVIARLLSRDGHAVTVFLACDPSEVTGDAALALASMREAGVVPRPATREALDRGLGGCDLVIDALLGTGTTGTIREPYASLIQAMADSGRPVLAVDIPSGLHADTGQPLGPVAPAVATVTFGLPKLGLVQYPGCQLAGEITVVDIGIPWDVLERASTLLIESSDAAAWLPSRPPDAHKGTAGRVLIVAGSPGLTGAACIVAHAACRTGSGLVTVAVPASQAASVEARSLESMTLPLRLCPERLDEAGVEEALEYAGCCSAIAIGPGLGRSQGTLEAVRTLLSRAPAPTVLDADGLQALRDGPLAVPASLTLTPHPGEMSAILGMAVQDVQSDRVSAALEAARCFGAVVVLKGARTVIAEPTGRVALNPTGHEGMASGGMGDALTGIIVSLLGQGVGPFEAACAGAYLHGLAASYAAEALGGRIGILARDLIEALPRARAAIATGEGPPPPVRRA